MTASNYRVPAVHTEEPFLVDCNKPLFAFFVVISMAILRAYFPVEPLFGVSQLRCSHGTVCLLPIPTDACRARKHKHACGL
jgi:hypothetical protein